MTSLHESIDALDVDELRRRGSVKWTDDPGMLGAFIAEMDFGTAPAVRDAIDEASGRCGFGYLPSHLTQGLREAFATFAEDRYGWTLPHAAIEVIPDVLSALEFTLRHLTRPGSAVVVPTPAYLPFLQIPQAEGRRVIQVPQRRIDGRYEMDLAALDAALGQDAGLLILCNPHNPTGRVYTRGELEAVSDLVTRHEGVRVFCDEIHAPVRLPGAQHLPFASLSATAATQAVTATSTSKAFGLPGLKCAQLILTHPQDRETWVRHGERTHKLTSTLGVSASIAAYSEGQDWLDEMLEYLAGARQLLIDLVATHLPGVRMDAPEASYVALLDCSELGLEESPAAFFRREAGVALTSGASCGEGFERHLRLVYATPRAVLTRMVERMGAALARR